MAIKPFQEIPNIPNDDPGLVSVAELYDKFQANSEVAVTALLNTFNRKKNAWKSVQKKFFETGNLDVTRLHDYKTSEDIFENGVSVRQEKNHGIMILVDWSGSMQAIMIQVMMQIDIMTRFCQRARIPFQVVHFTGGSFENLKQTDVVRKIALEENTQFIFPTRVLRTIVSSSMPIQVQKTAMFRFFLFAGHQTRSFDWHEYGVKHNVYDVIKSLLRASKGTGLIGNTPIAESILTLRYITRDFMKKNRIQLMNTIIMTDGEENVGLSGYRFNDTYSDVAMGKIITANPLLNQSIFPSNVNIAVQAYKAMTKSTVTGIYMVPNSSVGKTAVAKFFGRSISFAATEKVETGKGYFDAKNVFDFDRFLAVTTANITGYFHSSEIQTDVKKRARPTAANVASAYVAAAEIKRSALWLSNQVAEQICSEFDPEVSSSMPPEELSKLMEECRLAQEQYEVENPNYGMYSYEDDEDFDEDFDE